MAKKIIPIKYTSRDFESIKRDLVEYARRYYPDTFQDFNEASFGALMLDAVAYIGDVLSFYIDYQVNESFLETAAEYGNILRHGRTLGYKITGYPSSFGVVSVYVLVPANATGLGPDVQYLPLLLRGTTFSSAAGGSFTLNEDVDFSNPSNEVVAGKIDDATGLPTHYAVKAYGRVVSGRLFTKNVTIGGYQRFRGVRVGPAEITDIVSVYDSDGNNYLEVDHLSQNTVYKSIINHSEDKNLVTNIIKPVIAARRFTTERNSNSLWLQFGYGSHNELTTKSVPDAANLVLDMHARDHITATELDPSKLIRTDKFGIAPSDTTLTIVYRANNPGLTAASAGSINNVGRAKFRFDNMDQLLAGTMRTVRSSLEVTNEEAITGAMPEKTTEELKRRILGNFSTQGRAVTKQDYMALIYNMPGKFGSVMRANVIRDPDSFKRNLNVYVIGTNTNGTLGAVTATAKANLKKWLNQVRMINDTIDILDAKVVNYGITFMAKAITGADKNAVFNRCIRALEERYHGHNRLLDIGEPLYISDVYTTLNRVEGVLDVKSVKIEPRSGGIYSDTTFDFVDRKSADGTYISVPENVVLEMKFPSNDIQGTIK